MKTKKKQSLLIVDDLPENIELLARVLGNEVEILFALSGEKGLQICREQNPDLMLLDIMMPDMDGYHVIEELKADPQTAKLPVIFITGMDAQGEEAKGLEAGAVDYITKPIHPAVVRARVRNHLELKRYHDVLENLSSTDGLTGVANRRRFDEVMEREWRRGAHIGSPMSLVMIDIDCFKAYNDHYGHLEGDEVLRKLAAVVQESLRRPSDLAARYGGEEFACVLPETDNEGALIVAERIREGVRQVNIEHQHCVSDRVTISVGVATMLPDPEIPHPLLIREADAHLYRAKTSGKDRVCH